MPDLKTKPIKKSVEEFLDTVENPQKKEDCLKIAAMMSEVTKASPKMWGGSIMGFGDYHYKYASGREGDWFLLGLSPRKANISIYLCYGFDGFPEKMKKLGKYKTGKACLYIKKLEDIDQSVLFDLMKYTVKKLSENKSYGH